MRLLLFLAFLSLNGSISVHAARLVIEAPEFAGASVVLYRYMDYFTLREEVVERKTIGDSGKVEFIYESDTIELVQLKVNHAVVDFLIEPQAEYHIILNKAHMHGAMTISGAARIDPLFDGLDRFDINALLTDMNGHISNFLAERFQEKNLEDQRGARKELEEFEGKDSARIVKSTYPEQVDTLQAKLERYYSEVDHAFFKDQLNYAIAQLKIVPEQPRLELFEQYIQGKAIAHRSPEYVKFFKQFFGKHLLQFTLARNPDALGAAVSDGDLNRVMELAMSHEFLQNRELAELVVLHELYLEYGNEMFDPDGVLACLRSADVSDVHGQIASNMLWDLTAMFSGDRFPTDLALMDANGIPVSGNPFSKGYVYVSFSADWCTYCEQETNALPALSEEYNQEVEFVVIWMNDASDFSEGPTGVTSYFAGNDPLVFDRLRLRSLPAFFLLKDGMILQGPADPPSKGVAREFHAIKTGSLKEKRIKVWDD